jgi:hypothetical protein
MHVLIAAYRKRKQVMKEKRKLRDKMELQMIHPGDHIEELDDVDLFNIKKIKSKHVRVLLLRPCICHSVHV